MRKLRLLLIVTIAVLFFQNQAGAQCTPNTTLTDVGLYPDSLVAYVGAPFNDTTQAVLPTDTVVNFGTGNVQAYFCSYKIKGTTPDLGTLGLAIDCDQADCDYTVDHTTGGNVNWGCIVISGTPTQELDSIGVIIEAHVGTLVGTACNPLLTLPDTLYFQLKISDTTTNSIYKDLDRKALNFSLFPNPMEQSTQLQFDMPERGNVEIELYNTLGQKMKTVYSGVALGEQSVNITADGLANGLYFVRMNINQGERVITERLMINR